MTPSSPLGSAKAALGARKREILLEILIAMIAFAFAFVAHVASKQWTTALAVGLFIEILLVMFRFRVLYEPFIAHMAEHFDKGQHPFALIGMLAERTVPLQLLTDRPSEWVFQEYFDRLIREFRTNLQSLSDGTFRVPLDTAQDVSFEVCDRLENSAFCTAPLANLDLFMGARGESLREANFRAAKRLKDQQGFTRMFIFDSLAAVTWEYYLLMEANSEHDVEVLVAFDHEIEDILRSHRWEDRADFGLWDDEYLMTIAHSADGRRWMEVSKDEDLLETARLVIADLRTAASTWREFLQKFQAPVNQEQWANSSRALVALPAPNGPAQADCRVMCDYLTKELQADDRIAVYGLTKLLIETVAAEVTGHAHLNVQCDVVDHRFYRDDPGRPAVHFRQGNWITWRPEIKYRAVLGDDVLPNLGVWQVPLFFRALSDAIAPGGHFITRTAAMYSPDAMHPSWAEGMNRLRLFDAESPTHVEGVGLDDLDEGVVYEVAWPTLHSAEFYDEPRSSFDFGAWDERLRSEQGDTDFKAKLRLQYGHEVTVLEYGQLQNLARPYFQMVDEHSVYSVWDNTEKLNLIKDAKQTVDRFREYYKILVFERV
jgi:hypothetical protein